MQGKMQSSEEAARRMAALLFWGLSGFGVVGSWYLVSVLLARPFFASVCLAVLAFLLHYLSAADSVWHQSQSLENQFWMLVTFVSTGALMFAPDSPYAAPGAVARVAGVLVVLGSTTAAHFIDKYHHRNRLRAVPAMDVQDMIENATAEGLVEMLQLLLGQLDRTLPSTFHTMFNVAEYMMTERKILAVFSNCSRQELNYVVVRTEMKLLAYKLKNHNKPSKSPLNMTASAKQNRFRSGLMDILARSRVSDLNIGSRAVVLDIIQGLRMTVPPDTSVEAQEWVENLFLTVKGDDLSDLKQAVDNKGSAESMHKLIHHDITSAEVRGRILEHFRKQASVQAAQMAMRSSLARKRLLKSSWRKILSDVDDTLFSSGGRYPAGVDKSYKRKIFYPGVTALFRELNLGTFGEVAERGLWQQGRWGDLVFLSARPHVYKDVTETSMFGKFRKFIVSQELHCMPSLLPGDLESGQAFMMQGDFMPMAKKKMRNFEEYQSIYPEYEHIFIGDNGQADVKAAEFMSERFGTEVLRRVYIHEVQPRHLTFGYDRKTSQKKWDDYGIVFCKTYIFAAVDAVEQGLIHPLGLIRIIAAAAREFARIKHTWKDPYERDKRRLELNQDIVLANIELEHNRLPPVTVIPGDNEFPIGSQVYTFFGKGIVCGYRPLDGMYEVLLNWRGGCAVSPPRLFTLLHGVYGSSRRLTEAQKQLLHQTNNQTSSQRDGSTTRERAATRSSIPQNHWSSARSTASSTRSAKELSLARHSYHDVSDYIGESESPRYASGGSGFPAKVSNPLGFVTPAVMYPGKSKRRFHRRSTADNDGLEMAQEAAPQVLKVSTPTAGSAGHKDETGSLGGRISRRSTAGHRASFLSITQGADGGDDSSAGGAAGFGQFEEWDDILETGTRVRTPFGDGVVLAFRERDCMYELALTSFQATAFIFEDDLIMSNTKLFRDRASELVEEGSYPSRLFGLMKRLFVRDELPDEAKSTTSAGGNSTRSSGTASRAVTPVPGPGLEIDMIVKTPYGRGSIIAIRNKENVVQVSLIWGAMAFLQRELVEMDNARGSINQDMISELVKRHQSPLIKAKNLVAKNWALLKLPFSILGGSGPPRLQKSPSTDRFPTSESLLSLSSLVSASSSLSSTSSYFSFTDEQRYTDLWNLQVGDQVDTSGFGHGTILEMRDDGIFKVQLSFGVAYVSVPRLITDDLGPAIGCRVITDYGVGRILDFRPLDEVYVVLLEKWNATAYICRKSAHGTGRMSPSSAGFDDRLTDQGKGSLKSSILSFISNIYSSTGGDQAYTSTGDVSSPGSPMASPPSMDKVPVSVSKAHTTFSWSASDGSKTASLRVPPGHTAFSWGVQSSGLL